MQACLHPAGQASLRDRIRIDPVKPTRSPLLRVLSVLFLFATWGVASAPALAQDSGQEEPGPINTERPSFSSSPLTLPKGFWQIEAGFEASETGDLDAQSFPNSLFRFSLIERLELQLFWSGYNWNGGDASAVNGYTDAEIGLKWQVTDSDAALAIGLYGGMTLPVGDSALTSDDYDPKIGLFWAHDRSGLFGAITDTYVDSEHLLETGLGIGFSVFSGTSSFLELQSAFPEEGSSTHTLATAVIWGMGNDAQWDINAAAGLDSDAPDWVLGAGFSIRF